MPDASISLGLNATEMYGELKTAESRYAAGMDRMGNSNSRLAGSHDNLLRSSHRVASQIHNVASDLAHGATAGDLFATSLEGIGRSLNLSLGALAGLAIGGVAVAKIYELHEALKKANEEVDKLLHEGAGNSDFKSLSNLESHIGKVRDQIKRLKDESKGGMGQNIIDAFGENFFTENGEMLPDSGKADRRRSAQLAALQASAAEDQNSMLVKRHARTDLREDALHGAPAYETKAKELQIAHDELNSPLIETAQAALELKLAFDELAKSVTDKHMERAGMTVAEMVAGTSDIVPANDGNYERWKLGQDARAAQAAHVQGESARINFDPEGAHAGFNQEGAIKSGMNGLKPSEQMDSGFKGALQVTEEKLGQIAQNTTSMFAGK